MEELGETKNNIETALRNAENQYKLKKEIIYFLES